MTEEQQHGVVAQVLSTANGIATSLPPSFLALLLVNALFLGSVFWLVDRVSAQRAEFTSQLLTACIDVMGRK